MQISPINLNFNNTRNTIKRQQPAFSNLAPLKQDSVSFSAKYGTESHDMHISETKTDIYAMKQTKDYAGILNYFGYEFEQDEDGMLILENFTQPKHAHTLATYDVNEDEMFQFVKEIKGNADFSNSQVTNLGNLEKIGGDANFQFSQVEDFGKLEKIGGDVLFYQSKNNNLDNIEVEGRIFSH